MRHWRGRVAGFLAGLLMGGWLIATPAAQSYVWGAINGVPFGPGLVLSGPLTGTTASFVQGTLTTTATPNIAGSVTWNDGGTTHKGWRLVVTDTASAAGSLPLEILGGAAGGTTLLSVGKTGALTSGNLIQAGTSLAAAGVGQIYWASRGTLQSGADGVITAGNYQVNGFTTLNLGPTTGNTTSGTTSFTHVNATIDMATATGTGTGTITVAGFFTAGCKLDGFSARVTTILAGAGLTTWSAGTGGATTVFGTGLAIAANTVANSTTYTVNPATTFYGGAAKDLVITAAAGVFSTGVLKVTATCVTTTAIGS